MLAPARLAALRASTPSIIIGTLATIHRAIGTVISQLLATASTISNRIAGTFRDHVAPATRARMAWAGQTSAGHAARTAAARVAGTPAARATNAAAARAARVSAGHATRLARALPARARIPAAAAGFVALAAVAAVIVASVGAPGASVLASRPNAASGSGAQHAAGSVFAPRQNARTVTRHAQPQAPAQHAPAHAAAKHPAAGQAPAQPAGKQHASVAVKHAHAAKHVRHAPDLSTWRGITEAAAGHPHGGSLANAEKLLPAGLHGTQAAMPITPARAANAELITRQALRLHMGIRSAVIAVATAMQESTLENLGYGDRDSLGLFQQRPSAGWGSPAEITNPVYAADAFLHALASYQHDDPAWASQPLWESAQGVQRSGFPYAYAKWEDQAAHIVATATRHLL